MSMITAICLLLIAGLLNRDGDVEAQSQLDEVCPSVLRSLDTAAVAAAIGIGPDDAGALGGQSAATPCPQTSSRFPLRIGLLSAH
jgi:hypothetical protein